MDHYSQSGNAAADGCGLMALIGGAVALVIAGGLIVWLITSM